MTGFRVIKGGILSLIQDSGRLGFQHLGVTRGGPLDANSAYWANRLLDNVPDAAVIEVTAGGLELESRTQTMVAITGGDLNLTVNGEPQIPWRSFWVRQGDRLKFGTPRYGFRAYLAVSGGFQTPEVLGSRSTVMRDHLGGVNGNGEPLQAGDELPCKHLIHETLSRQIPQSYLPQWTNEVVLHVIPGYQQHHFSKDAWQTLWQSEFTLSTDSNRQGARLHGPEIEAPSGSFLSEGVSYGAIQIPPDGQPIIMLEDRQTLGGYPKLGNILPLDGFELAQCAPGAKVRFQPISLAEAQQQMRRYLRFFGL
ncbi:biotin-dependent carboxyltransferase family protein [Aliidiomarina haloalkalitolerans]|uniref:Allophanate hydrolase n=1 Tax=Aliidiomarina haloalkalitolerans TaxID=859059 RepID=A0A432VZ08_9GAMM|nr:biotin-dependent carboxyltransferase family protein [Aliidiomarina haloalkalitolerans]RUO21896.1 allophanate hydrolase [Aliidiomarina haloalkalitolerans]